MAKLQPSLIKSQNAQSLQHNKNVENVLYLYAAMGFHPITVSINDRGVRQVTVSNGTQQVMVTLDVKSNTSYQKILDNAVSIGKTITRTCGGNATLIPQSFRDITNDQEVFQLTADIIMRQCSNQFGKFDNKLALDYCHILDTTIIGNKAYSWYSSPVLLEQATNEPDAKKKVKETGFVTFNTHVHNNKVLHEAGEVLYGSWHDPQARVSRWVEKLIYSPTPESITRDRAFLELMGDDSMVREGK